MIKTIQRYIIFAAAVIIAGSVLLGMAYSVYTRAYTPDSSETFQYGEEAEQIVSLRNKCALITGSYTEGDKAGVKYCKIYDVSGKPLNTLIFDGEEGRATEITGILPLDTGAVITALAEKAAAGTAGGSEAADSGSKHGIVYRIDVLGRITSEITFTGSREDGFDRFVCADSEGEYFAGIKAQNVTLFDKDGNIKLEFVPENMREMENVSRIYDVCVRGGRMLIAGCNAENGLVNNFHCGYYAITDLEGNIISENRLLDQDNVFSAILKVEETENGYLLYGRYMRDADEREWLPLDRLEEYTQAEIFRRFHIGKDSATAVNSSVFMISTDDSCNVQNNAIYTPETHEYVPVMASYDIKSSESRIIMGTYSADRQYANFYDYTLIRLSSELQETSLKTITLRGDTEMICAPDITGGGIYMYISTSGSGVYRLTHFTSVNDAIEHFKTVEKMRKLKDFLPVLKPAVPVFICLYVMLVLSSAGAKRARERD